MMIFPSQWTNTHTLKAYSQYLSQESKSIILTETDKKRSAIRSAIGQFNWLASASHPEMSFSKYKTSAQDTEATVQDNRETNKIIKFAKSNRSFIIFLSLHLPSVKVTMYSDASFNNLCDGASQGGHIVLLTNQFNNSCPISWKSNKVRKIARSALAEETLSFSYGSDPAYFITQLAEEAGLVKSSSPIFMYTDNRSLHDSANNTTQVSDRRLCIEISTIREQQDNGEIYICWVSKEKQLADGLTKKGAACTHIMSVSQEAKAAINFTLKSTCF